MSMSEPEEKKNIIKFMFAFADESECQKFRQISLFQLDRCWNFIRENLVAFLYIADAETTGRWLIQFDRKMQGNKRKSM